MPSRLLPVITVLVLAVTGCDTAAEPPAPSPSTSSSVTGASSSPDAQPRTSTLRFTWTSQGKTWRRVLAVPYGRARNELGIDEFPDQAPIVPSSLAVTNGGFAIGDPAKNRVVVLSPAGEFLQQWDGLPQVLSDLAADPTRDRLIAITHEYEQELTALNLDGSRRSKRLDQVPIALSEAPDGVGILLKDEEGQETDTSLNANLRVSEQANGFPAGEGNHVTEVSLSQEGDLHRVTSTAGWAHDFQLRATSPPRKAVTTFDSDFSAAAGNLYFAMRIGAFSPYPGPDRPLHLLVLDADTGTVESFEHIAMCSLSDTTNQYGYIAVRGPDVYQLCLGQEGAEIRQRQS